jgi:hypothetical protein
MAIREAQQALAEAFLRLHSAGMRHGEALAQQTRRLLLALQAQLRQHILMYDPMQALQRSQQAWLLTSLLTAIAEAIDMTYQEIETMLEDASLALALQYADQLASVLKDTHETIMFDPGNVTPALTVALRTTPFPSAATGTQPSAVASAWWLRQGVVLTQRAQDQMRAGVLAGELGTVLAHRLTGTPAFRGKDGLMAQALRTAEMVAQAQAAMALMRAVEALTEANPGRVVYLEHVSTLDERTSALCTDRDGKRFDPMTHEPIGHEFPYLSGCPYHPNCRSLIKPVLHEERDR